MITIFICDSDEASCVLLEKVCQRLERELHLPVCSETCRSGEELLAHMSPAVDIVLLDTRLPAMSGIEAARRIRSNNTAVQIIFISGDSSAAAESYKVRAANFLSKPVKEEEVFQAVTEAIQMLVKTRSDYVTIRTPSQWVRLPMNSILYAESARNKVIIHTILNCYELYISMKDLQERLDSSRFFRCHSGYIVNFSNIVQVSGMTAITIDGSKINISKSRRKEFLERFTCFTGKELV